MGSKREGDVAWLTELRAEIEAIDRSIVEQLAARVERARAVGRAKRQAGLPTLDPRREAAVVRRAADLGRAAGLPGEAVRDIFWHVIGLCRRAQLDPTGDG